MRRQRDSKLLGFVTAAVAFVTLSVELRAPGTGKFVNLLRHNYKAARQAEACNAKLDKDIFKHTAEIWALKMPGRGAFRINRALKRHGIAQKFIFPRRRGVRPVFTDSSDSQDASMILLAPNVRFESMPDEIRESVKRGGGREVPFLLELGYESLGYKEAVSRCLPDHVAIPISYEIVGQLACFNLQEEHRPYRHLIGQIFLDKAVFCKTVVAKLGVSGAFRTFEMEVIAGRNDTNVILKERGLLLKFDLREVYWNSRRGEERAKVASFLNPGDALLDLSAGVGALALLCRKRGFKAVANDLNPAAAHAAKQNALLNNLHLPVFQLDARDLLRELFQPQVVACHVLPPASQMESTNRITLGGGFPKLHLVFCLPELALEMLCEALRSAGLEESCQGEVERVICSYCYCFGESEDEIRARLLSGLGFIPVDTLVHNVGSMATCTYLYRVQFKIFLGTFGLSSAFQTTAQRKG